MPKLITVPEPLEWLHTAAPDGNLSAREVMRLLQCSAVAKPYMIESRGVNFHITIFKGKGFAVVDFQECIGK
jgi:hypothetical protein